MLVQTRRCLQGMRSEKDGVRPEVRGTFLDGRENTAFRVREAPAFVHEGGRLVLSGDYVVARFAEDKADVGSRVLVAFEGDALSVASISTGCHRTSYRQASSAYALR